MSARSSVLVVLVCVGISVPASLLLQGRAAPVPPPARHVPAVDPSRIEALEARIERLELRVSALQAAAPKERVAVRTPPRDDRTALRSLEMRLANLERKPDLPRPIRPQLGAADAKRALADPQATVAEKIAAHGSLRRVPDAYTPAMIQELIRIGSNDADPRNRADVWRFFDGASKPPEVVQPLLGAVFHDAADIVREEASETLGNYADDPDVLAALRQAAESDPSERVRNKAKRTLADYMARRRGEGR